MRSHSCTNVPGMFWQVGVFGSCQCVAHRSLLDLMTKPPRDRRLWIPGSCNLLCLPVLVVVCVCCVSSWNWFLRKALWIVSVATASFWLHRLLPAPSVSTATNEKPLCGRLIVCVCHWQDFINPACCCLCGVMVSELKWFIDCLKCFHRVRYRLTKKATFVRL